MTLLLLTLLAADPNAEGFELYEKGEYAKAQRLFEKATKATPKNAWAWVNLARTRALLSKGADPDDYCEAETNWVLLALSDLDQAVKLSKAPVLKKLGEADPGTLLLAKRVEYQVWREALAFTGEATQLVGKWHTVGAGIPTEGELAAVDPKAKVVELGGKKYQPKVIDWFFAQGTRSFKALVLENVKDPADVQYRGPLTSDCGQ